METLTRGVTNYMVAAGSESSEAIESAKLVVQGVNNGNVQESLLQLIQAMGEYLTNDDGFVRAKATSLLSHTLRSCKHDAINSSAVSVLVNFYCERLRESECVPSLLDGLVTLTHFPNLTKADAVVIIKSLIKHVEVQRYPHTTKNLAFQVIDNLLQNHLAALKSINNEFITGFTQIMDGEKDPRNLICAFRIVQTIAEQFDITSHVEDLFEVTFCYFPITFRPPPDDPYGITAEDLKVSLRRCLSASPLFAKLAVPLILEKLTSTSGSAKKDSIETLAACAPVYGANALLPNIDDVMETLKVEVFHAADQSLEEAALKGISELITMLGSAVTATTGADPTERALKPLLNESLAHLRDPDLKNAKQTGRLLRAISSASDHACHIVVKEVMPLLLHTYRDTQIAVRHKSILDVILELLEASKSLYDLTNHSGMDMDQEIHSPLAQYKDRLFAIFQPAAIGSTEYIGLRLSGIQGLKLMVLTQGYLSPGENSIAVQSLNQILFEETDQELRQGSLEALQEISRTDAQPIVEQTIKALGDRLPETAANDSFPGYLRLLYAFKVLSPVPTVFAITMPLLLAKFDDACEKDNDPAYPQAIVTTLLDILKTKVNEKHSDVAPCMDVIIAQFMSSAIRSALNLKSAMIFRGKIVETMALIIVTIFEQLNAASQKERIDHMFDLFMRGNLSTIHIEATTTFYPLEITAPEPQKKTTQLFAAMLTSCRKEVVFPVDSVEGFLDQLISLVEKTECQAQAISLVRVIGSIINKWKDNTAMTDYVRSRASRLEASIDNNTAEASKMMTVYIWMTKALIMRKNDLGYAMASKMIDWCSKPSHETPCGFDVLLGDDPLALRKSSFATTAILYEQRFFTFCLPKLIDGFHVSKPDVKPNYLIALSYLLKNVPKQILLIGLPPLVPLLIESLSLQNPTLKVSTLDTFTLAINEVPTVVAQNIDAILPPLFALLDPETNPMSVRAAALHCLSQFPESLPHDILLPHSKHVTKQLSRSLDDKKRLVRREAVDCREKWFIDNV